MGKLNFRGHLISRFFPTRQICENLMHAKNTCFIVIVILITRRAQRAQTSAEIVLPPGE